MQDKTRHTKASGEMPRPTMGEGSTGTEMPSGEMNAGGASGGMNAPVGGATPPAVPVGTTAPGLYDEMFGLHEITSAHPVASGTMPEAPAGGSSPSAVMPQGPTPGSAIGGEPAVGQSTIEITGRWRVTLTPAP